MDAQIHAIIESILSTPLDTLEDERDRLNQLALALRRFAGALEQELADEYDWYLERVSD
jgi:hypothetical protein